MSTIRIEDIAFVRFRAPDLAQMRGFLEDFGLSVIEHDGRLFARGTGANPFLHSTELGQGSAMLLTLSGADALAAIGPEVAYAAGTPVDVIPLDALE